MLICNKETEEFIKDLSDEELDFQIATCKDDFWLDAYKLEKKNREKELSRNF